MISCYLYKLWYLNDSYLYRLRYLNDNNLYKLKYFDGSYLYKLKYLEGSYIYMLLWYFQFYQFSQFPIHFLSTYKNACKYYMNTYMHAGTYIIYVNISLAVLYRMHWNHSQCTLYVKYKLYKNSYLYFWKIYLFHIHCTDLIIYKELLFQYCHI